VKPPNVKLNKNPLIKRIGIEKYKQEDQIVDSQLNILMPVGIAIIDVMLVKYILVTISKPTINIWCPHTINPIITINNKAIIIESLPNIIH